MRKLLTLAAILILSCAHPEGPDRAGTGSGAGNALISGILYGVNGKRAAHAQVSFVPVSQDPTASLVLLKTTTDAEGVYGIDAQLTGTYNVFGSDGLGNLSFSDSVEFTGDTAVIDPDTLEKSGGLHVVFKVQPQDDPRLIDLIFWGTDRQFVPVDPKGVVTLSNLAPGIYPVRIKSGSNYAVVDTFFTIVSGQVTELDTFELKYLQVPVVTGLVVRFDTLLTLSHLSWIPADSGSVSGYNVYRGKAGATFSDVPINSALVTDTFFTDSSLTVGESYIYKIKALSKNGDVGATYSAGDTVVAASPVSATTVLVVASIDTVSIFDTVKFVLTFQNPTRTLKKIEWYEGFSTQSLVRTKAISAKLGADTLKYAWSGQQIGSVEARVMDDAGTVWRTGHGINVVLDPPKLTTFRDTAVKVTATLTLKPQANDRFGSIAKYYWDLGANGWDDSTTAGQKDFTYPAGGGVNIAVGVRDDDGQFEADTMRALFSRPPSSVQLLTPQNGDTMQGGASNFTWQANDPDGGEDSLVYLVYLEKNNPPSGPPVYAGPKTTLNSLGLFDSSTTYYWRVKVHDRVQDSIWSNSGFFFANKQIAHVFWYKGSQYSLNDNPGPNLPINFALHEGIMVSGGIAQHTGSQLSTGVTIGSGLDDSQGRCGFIWSKELSNAVGTVDSAKFRGEFKDLYAGSAFCNSGPIRIRCGVVDFQGNLDTWGGTDMVPETADWQDFLNPLGSAMGYDLTNPTLGAEETIDIQAPAGILKENDPPVLNKQFFNIDITDQVNWILKNPGQHAIVFLVNIGEGSTGKVNLFADESGGTTATPAYPSWTQDGNTTHIVVFGDITVP